MAVLIYHSPGPIAGDTLRMWREATGSGDCSHLALLRLARRVLAMPDTEQSPNQGGVSE